MATLRKEINHTDTNSSQASDVIYFFALYTNIYPLPNDTPCVLLGRGYLFFYHENNYNYNVMQVSVQ